MEKLFDVRPVKKKLDQFVRNYLKEWLDVEVIDVSKISSMSGVLKTYKIDIKNGESIRLDINFPGNLNKLQKIALNNNIEFPKILLIKDGYKFSQWVEGVMLARVWDIAEVFSKSGDLVGRLNCVKDPDSGKFLTNSEFSSTNSIWTEDKKVFIIDHDRLKTSDNPDDSVVQILLKRIREKERINLFLKSYSKYRGINNIMEKIERRNWNWDKRKTLMTNVAKLKY